MSSSTYKSYSRSSENTILTLQLKQQTLHSEVESNELHLLALL